MKILTEFIGEALLWFPAPPRPEPGRFDRSQALYCSAPLPDPGRLSLEKAGLDSLVLAMIGIILFSRTFFGGFQLCIFFWSNVKVQMASTLSKKKLVFFSQVSANTAFDFVPMQRIFKLFGHGLCTVLLLCVDDSALPSSKDVVDTCRCFDYIFQLIWIVWACDDSKKKLGFFREITFKFSNKSAKFFFQFHEKKWMVENLTAKKIT